MKNTYGIVVLVLLVLWVLGVGQILGGFVVGTLIVAALMMTIEKLPGFWRFATWGPGMIVVLFGTAWLTHAVVGRDTVTGMIALAWSVLLKVLLIDERRRSLKQGV